MISSHVRIEGFDARSWTNLLSLFAPGVVDRIEREPVESDAPETQGVEEPGVSGTLVISVSESGQVRKAFHTLNGRIRGLDYHGHSSLPEIHQKYGARRTLVVLDGALEEIAERAAQRVSIHDDYLAQCLTLFRVIGDVIEEGKIHVFPKPRVQVPVPTSAMVGLAFDTLLPNDSTFSMMIWNGNVPWTAVVLRRRLGAIDLIAGPDWIARWSGPLGGDWRRDHRFVSDGVSRSVAPVHLGIYGQLDDIRRLLRAGEPGVWASAIALRDVIVSPTPAYVAVALGADVARAAASKTSEWLHGIDALSRLGPVLGYLRSRITEVASVTHILGFDPLKALAASLRARDESRPKDP